MNNQKVPMIILSECVVFPGSSVYLNLYDSRSENAVSQAIGPGGKLVGVTRMPAETADDDHSKLYSVGTLLEVKQMNTPRKGHPQAVVRGVCRVMIEEVHRESDCYYCEYSEFQEIESEEDSQTILAMGSILNALQRKYAEFREDVPATVWDAIADEKDRGAYVDQLSGLLESDYTQKQKLLEEPSIDEREKRLAVYMTQEINLFIEQEKIQKKIRENIDKKQMEMYLREQIDAIHEELGDDDVGSQAAKYLHKLEKLKAPKRVKKAIREEIMRYQRFAKNPSESEMIRDYLDNLFAFPWKKKSEESLDIAYAAQVLDEDHYGLTKVKERILECLAVKAMKKDAVSPILCLVGPPGTGKTSIARLVARALGRSYVRICLGGVNDEAEIRGHRRTYVASMPGRIVKAFCQAKTNNPLVLLDEIDKIGKDYKGDPSAALLEVLDPEQNKHFSDHYMEIPINLSHAMFWCTANSLESIPLPLRDRMEIIQLSGYTDNEKFHIAKEFLWKKQKNANGLTNSQITITDKAIRMIIARYTREAGVRDLERKLILLCQKAAKSIATGEKDKVRISERNLKEYLGKEVHTIRMANKRAQVGIVRGLAWTAVGGETLEVEVGIMPGNGKLLLTGKLGDVMKESAQIALTYVRSQTAKLVKDSYYAEHDIHIHVPEGAVPKDGPSAGVTMATALYSAVTGWKVRADIAMTGEISLRGSVLAIGGLKEKMLAAKAAGIAQVFIPKDNESDLAEFSEDILEGITVTTVSSIKEIWKQSIETASGEA